MLRHLVISSEVLTNPNVQLAAFGQVMARLGILLHLDFALECLYIEAMPFHTRSAMRVTLDLLSIANLELISEDECEPELMPNGATRIYLTFKEEAYARRPRVRAQGA